MVAAMTKRTPEQHAATLRSLGFKIERSDEHPDARWLVTFTQPGRFAYRAVVKDLATVPTSLARPSHDPA